MLGQHWDTAHRKYLPCCLPQECYLLQYLFCKCLASTILYNSFYDLLLYYNSAKIHDTAILLQHTIILLFYYDNTTSTTILLLCSDYILRVLTGITYGFPTAIAYLFLLLLPTCTLTVVAYEHSTVFSVILLFVWLFPDYVGHLKYLLHVTRWVWST